MDLFNAAWNGDLPAVSATLRGGARLNAQDSNGSTALFLAVDGKWHNVVRFLLDKGADPNVTDRYGQTPLMIAAGRNDSVSTRLLIQARTNLRIRSKSGLTALGFALDNGSQEAAALIKKAGGR
jgi:ankyrin repeat protein